MTEIKIEHNAPLTVTVDIDALLRSPGEPERDFDGDFVEPGAPLYAAIVHETARLLAGKIEDAVRQTVGQMAADEAKARVDEIVAAVVTEGHTEVNGWGSRVTIKPLREVIEEQVKGWLGQGGSARFGDQAPMAKLVRDQVDVALKRDFTAMFTEEREKVVARMKDVAAALFATEATKR
jgi:hypothetical protein